MLLAGVFYVISPIDIMDAIDSLALLLGKVAWLYFKKISSVALSRFDNYDTKFSHELGKNWNSISSVFLMDRIQKGNVTRRLNKKLQHNPKINN